MDKRALQTYSTWAKENLENQIEVSLKALGINDDNNIKKAKRVGDVTTIEGDPTSYPADLYSKREQIIKLVQNSGYKNVIEEFAYTWFNRFVALRFMEVHGFLSHGFRVLSNPAGGIEPEILKNLNLVKDDLKLDMNVCVDYKQQGKIEELFRYVLMKQCAALSGILPMLFAHDNDYLELLLPKTLLKGENVLSRLLEITEESFLEDVEIIGWMYQFYISAKKDAVNKAKKTITKDTLPAVTQLFTPDWIVRYMAENSVGRLWLESYPNSPLRHEMKYYVDDAEQTEEVQRKLDAIKYKNVNPEDIRIIEPCSGSGHILVYVFDLLYKMYEEKGYQKREIPTLILTKNLYGLDVDKRAAQLASFSLIMRARSVNSRFFNDNYYVVPQVYEIHDSRLLTKINYKKQMDSLGILSEEEKSAVNYIVDVFKDAKTIGSLLKIKPIDFTCLDEAIRKMEKDSVYDLFNMELSSQGVPLLKRLSVQAKVLTGKYDVLITNPPYLSPSAMENSMKEYAADYYPNSKADMFAMFMETGFIKNHGFMSMVNMHNWMSLSSFEQLRAVLLESKEIISMVHLGSRAFESINGEIVQTTSFVMRNCRVHGIGEYFKLVDSSDKEKDFLEALADKKSSILYHTNEDNFFDLPGQPFSYWVSSALAHDFKIGKKITTYIDTFQGIITGDNEKFLRFWYEVSSVKIPFHASEMAEIDLSKQYWIPYNKGGEFRKWYGVQDYVVNWMHGPDDKTRGKKGFSDYYLREYVAWSYTVSDTIATRYYPEGFLWDVRGSGLMDKSGMLYYLEGLIASKIGITLFRVNNSTLSCQVENIIQFPIIISKEHEAKVEAIVLENNVSSKEEWDNYELSWDFREHPLCPNSMMKEWKQTQFAAARMEKAGRISWHFERWQQECEDRFYTLKANEEELNRIFIDIYGLQDELTPDVSDDAVTVRLADVQRDIRSLISYFIGIIMGRYSLDVSGLAYAGGRWDDTKYGFYQPDDDGIVPIYSTIGMEDGLTTKIIELIKLIYGEDTYRENIDFIAEALGKNNNESSEETLNRYLNDGFYADHLKIYQKRPIYWLFTSGKKAGFKCLIYMHRYNEDTLARINGKYFLPESTRKKNELEELNGRIAHAEGRDKLRLEKSRQNLAAAYNEAIEYGQVLDHMANKYISIDLDDGVKENYAKFQGIQIVTDSGTKVKKDLLLPLK